AGRRAELLLRVAAGETVPARAVGGGVQRARLARVNGHVDEAGLLVEELDLGPGPAAVAGLVQPALGVWRPDVAQGRDVDDVRFLGMNHDPANVPSVAQAGVVPGLAAVGRFVNAVAIADAVARVGLAGADIEDIGIGR